MNRSRPETRSLPWQEPWTLTLRLARELGIRGLVLREGDGSPLGRQAVLGADPFARLAAMASSGGAWLRGKWSPGHGKGKGRPRCQPCPVLRPGE